MRLRPVLAAARGRRPSPRSPGPARSHRSAGATPAASSAAAAQPAGKHAEPGLRRRSCTAPPAMALRLDPATASAGVTPAAATPSGLFPADLQSAYKLPSATAGAGQTVAIVDAYDDPTAEADLGVYRSQFGLPACTTANGCFKQGRPDRRHRAPAQRTPAGPRRSRSTSTWSRRSARTATSCWSRPTAPSFANLGAAVNTAARLAPPRSATATAARDASDATYGSYYNHPGIAVTASSGDGGYGVELPGVLAATSSRSAAPR